MEICVFKMVLQKALPLLAVSGLLATSAYAQEMNPTGIYGVARIGASITPKQKIDLDNLSAAFPDDAKYKAGLTGEIGVGYDFGRFRIEQTVGYSRNDLKSGDLRDGGFDGDGRATALNVTVAGYVDLPITERIVPFIGGGVGAARVKSNLSAVDAVTRADSGFSGKDWGLLWRADAGAGYRLAPATTLELGVRYTEISKLSYEGVSAGTDALYKPKLSTVSATVGVRHVF